MSVSPLAPVDEPMTWAQYESMGEDPRAEYIDGRRVVTPSPSRQHQQVVHRLVTALTPAIPTELVVTAGWSWKPGPDEFIPDVMVHARTDESIRFTGTPVLLVEVLSSNRADDLVVKTGKYGRYGVPHYWIADPLEPSLAAFTLTGAGLYRRVVHLSSGDVTDLPFGPAVARIDVDALFTD